MEKIHKFYEVLLFNIESLQTLQSLNKLDAAVRFTFDNLGVIKNELAMIDGNWSEWSFAQFLEALGKWTINNPIYQKLKGPRSWLFLTTREKKQEHFAQKVMMGTRRPPVDVYFVNAPITKLLIVTKS